MRIRSLMRILRFVALAGVLAGGAGMPVGAQSDGRAALNPARTASLNAATRRIEDRFVGEVAAIVGITPAQVRRAMPDERRITSAASRLISALEVELGVPLTVDQRTAILDADYARKQSLQKAREAASGN